MIVAPLLHSSYLNNICDVLASNLHINQLATVKSIFNILADNITLNIYLVLFVVLTIWKDICFGSGNLQGSNFTNNFRVVSICVYFTFWSLRVDFHCGPIHSLRLKRRLIR